MQCLLRKASKDNSLPETTIAKVVSRRGMIRIINPIILIERPPRIQDGSTPKRCKNPLGDYFADHMPMYVGEAALEAVVVV
jgi:hypothetical protein